MQRYLGLIALVGLSTFLLSISVLHILSAEINWVDDYVSYLANEPQGWLFGFGAFVHGLGNLALAFGLRAVLQPGRLRDWAVSLFAAAAVGILLTAIFPIDPIGAAITLSGRIHRTLASGAFVLELISFFIFSVAFARDRNHHWQQQKYISLSLAIISALAVVWFLLAEDNGVMLGLAERAALGVFMLWEIWIIIQLIRPLNQQNTDSIDLALEQT
ncbi:MAG: DUF998 domain-containing protein [Xanthomonadales bacterium]|nr:DUF998 domain-containing protein [Xanthomonadales bacterium]